jgi:predicted ArsR family transcriptional regulator
MNGRLRDVRESGAAELDRFITALQDPTRRRILLALVDDDRPHTIDELAGVAGVHRTVAFNHLERLLSLGYLDKSRRRGFRGKPASLYSLRSGWLAVTYPARQFPMLAGALASGLAVLGADGRDAARNAGLELGARVATGAARSTTEALRPLEWMGADYRVDGRHVTAGTCVFLEACNQARETVCGFQAGILEGTLRGAGIHATVRPRGPVPPHGCAYQVTRSTGAKSRR